MRTIQVNEITRNIREMCIEANHFLSPDMEKAMKNAVQREESPLGRQILEQLQENLRIAGNDMIPICQDTGMAVIFMEIGQDVHFEGGDLETAYAKDIQKDTSVSLCWQTLCSGRTQRTIHLQWYIMRLYRENR